MPSRERKVASRLLASLAVIAVLAPGRASAFCRTTTVRPPSGFENDACWTEGIPLFHPSQCLPYRLRTVESTVIPNAVLSEKLARAFAAWTAPNATCIPRVNGIELAPVGAVPIIAYSIGGSQQNVLGVADSWSGRAAETVSNEQLTYSMDTGEIRDVDVELNPDVTWSFTDVPADGAIDLQSALTHAVGHMLGFAHSSDLTSVMFPTIDPGATKRALADDDVAAICSVYAVQRAPCVLTAGSPEARCDERRILHGCATTDAPTPTGLGVFAAASGLVLLRCARRRRR